MDQTMKPRAKTITKKRLEPFSQWLQIFALIGMIWLVAYMAIATTAQASGPLLTYETAVPGEAPSWLLVYEDGRVERDLAPYMKQAGRKVGQLDSSKLAAVRALAKAVLNVSEDELQQSPQSHADEDQGMVTVSVSLGGQHRSLQWRPVPGLDTKPAPIDLDATLASLLYEPI